MIMVGRVVHGFRYCRREQQYLISFTSHVVFYSKDKKKKHVIIVAYPSEREEEGAWGHALEVCLSLGESLVIRGGRGDRRENMKIHTPTRKPIRFFSSFRWHDVRQFFSKRTCSL